MSTNALTLFKDEHKKEVVLYTHWDGYPSGYGADLCEFLAGGKIVNGIQGEATLSFNGMGCLAAQVVAKFKDKQGDFYLYPSGTRDIGEEWVYEVSGSGNRPGLGESTEPRVRVFKRGFGDNSYAAVFEGPATEALAWCRGQE